VRRGQGLKIYFHLEGEMSILVRRRIRIVGMHQVRYTLFVIVARRKFIILLSIGTQRSFHSMRGRKS
jgi:hypothetical protein